MGDLGSIPGLRRSPGEGKGYPLQYSAWRIPWTVQSMGSQRVGHDWATFTLHCFNQEHTYDTLIVTEARSPTIRCWIESQISLPFCFLFWFCFGYGGLFLFLCPLKIVHSECRAKFWSLRLLNISFCNSSVTNSIQLGSLVLVYSQLYRYVYFFNSVTHLHGCKVKQLI